MNETFLVIYSTYKVMCSFRHRSVNKISTLVGSYVRIVRPRQTNDKHMNKVGGQNYEYKNRIN